MSANNAGNRFLLPWARFSGTDSLTLLLVVPIIDGGVT
jgi:hypothetical protein